MTKTYINRGYTDLLLVVGPDRRSLWLDFQELRRYYPEELLGFNIMLLSRHELARALHGFRVNRIILLGSQDWELTHVDDLRLRVALSSAPFPRYEWWNLNPGHGRVGRVS